MSSLPLSFWGWYLCRVDSWAHHPRYSRSVCTLYRWMADIERLGDSPSSDPLTIALALVTWLAVLGLREPHRVRRAITESDRFVVRTGGNCHRDLEHEQISFKTEGAQAIRALAPNSSIGWSMVSVYCGCWGDIAFDLSRSQELHYSFGLHRGNRVRRKEGPGEDKALTPSSRAKLAQWLEPTGITASLFHGELRKK